MKKLLSKREMFVLPLLLLMILSIISLYNTRGLSTIYKYNYLKQIIWFVVGVISFFVVQKINTKKLFKYSIVLYVITNLLLLYCLIWGDVINGARAWIKLKFFSFQPSELMKLSLTLVLSNILCKYKNTGIKSEFVFLSKIFIFSIIPSVLVFLEPDTGAIIFYLLIDLSIILLSYIHKFWYYLVGFIIILSLAIFIYFYLFNKDLLISLIGTSFFYRVERLVTFKTMNSYQLGNALIGIGSSEFLNLIPLNKIYIPEAHTDFIFSYIITNFGFIFGFIIFILYFLMDVYLINKLFNIENGEVKCVLMAFTIMFLFGQVINISMNLGLLPIMGIPLPFLSYGGSTIIIYFLFLGIAFKKPYFHMT